MTAHQSQSRGAVREAPSVLFIADSLGCGGSERQLVELACELDRCGVRVAVVSYRPADFFAARLDSVGIERVQLERGGWNNVRFFRRLRSLMRTFDIVHPFRPRPCAWAALARRTLPSGERPILVAGERSWGPNLQGAARMGFRWVFRQAAAVTVNNATAARRMVRLLDRSGSRVELIGNGIDLARWDAAAKDACPLSIEPRRFNLGQIGGIRPEKNQLLLLAALGRIPAAERADWRLWLIGDSSRHPEYLEELSRTIDELGLEEIVRLSPALANIAPVMGRLDGLLVPSLREGFPNVILEAMASSVPVIGGRIGAMGELIDHQRTGLQVENHEPAAWAEAISALAACSESERQAMGRLARSRVEAELQMDEIGARYRQLYASFQEALG